MSNNSTDKMIQILSPITGMTFKIELNGDEQCLRELLGTILEIPSSSIRGIKDTYNNYYTLSSALKSKNINTSPNNYYSIVTENILSNNDYDIRKYTLNSNYNSNKDFFSNPNLCYFNTNYINEDNLFFNRINNIQSINYPKLRNNIINNNYYRNYNIKDYFFLINFLYKNNYIDNKNYYKLKKCIEINNKDVIDIMKPFIEFDDNYDKLINNLFPILNLDLTVNDEFSIKSNNSIEQYDVYKNILNNLKEYFSSDNMKQLNYLLLMENIDIIKIFKLYYKTRDKQNLINNLYSLLKKLSKINLNKNNRSKSKNGINKIFKERKSKSQNYVKVSKKNNNYMNNIQNHKSKKKNKKENELLNEYTNKIIDYGKQFRKDIYYLLKFELKNITEEDKKKLFNSKFKINLNSEDGIELNNTNKKHIKNYYNKYIQINLYKFLNEEEKKIYDNIIEETNSQEYHDLLDIYNDLIKNSKSKNKIELLRNRIINYIKQLIEQNEEEINDEEKQESKETNDNKESNEKESEEEDNIIKIETNEEEDQEDDNKNEKKEEEKESSFCSSTVMDVDDEEEEQNFEGESEESGVSIRKANRPRKN